MKPKATTQRYHWLMRAVHWGMAACIFTLWPLGWYMASLDEKAPGKYDLYDWHEPIGVIVLMLIAIRVVLRLTTKIPPLPAGIRPIEKKVSHIAHFALYCLLLVVPAVGVMILLFGDFPVPFLAPWTTGLVEKNHDLLILAKKAHQILAYSLLALVLAHVAGALKHRFFEAKENDVIGRML